LAARGVGGDTSAGQGFLDTSIKKKKRKKEVLVVRVLAVTHLVVWKVSSILVLRKEKKGSGSAVRSVGLVLAVTHLVVVWNFLDTSIKKKKKKNSGCAVLAGCWRWIELLMV
jgi:protein-S-isoprenylcysteine O-methyltransferase Ste14